MMYQKAVLFSDPAMASQILHAQHPRQVKALGRKVSNFSDKVWNAHREAIVRRGNRLKFTRPANPADGMWRVALPGRPESEGLISLKELLLRTGAREIVEASPMDRVWGIGFGAAKAGSVREKWGLNLLGKALVAVRDELRKEAEKGEEKGAEGVGEAAGTGEGGEKGAEEAGEKGEGEGDGKGEDERESEGGKGDGEQSGDEVKGDSEEAGDEAGEQKAKRRKTEKRG
jgi:predicted NAD-dependent protein-ADP-ribosyltransferase YbiA (DUF1768 family)